MGSRREMVIFVLYMILFHMVCMPRSLAGRKGMERFLVGVGDSSGSREVDGSMMEQIRCGCNLDLMDLDDFSHLKDIICSYNGILQRTALHPKGSREGAIPILSPEIKNQVIDCLSKGNFQFHVSDKDSPTKLFEEFLESLLNWHRSSRRLLAVQPAQTEAPAFASVPTLAPDTASTPSTSTGIAPPSHGVAPFSVPSTAAQSKKQDNHKPAVIAAVTCAVGALLLAALLSYCYFRHCRKKINLDYGRVHDLTLSSLQKPFPQGNTTNKVGVLPLKSDPSQSANISSLGTNSYENTQPRPVEVSNSPSEPSLASTNTPPKPPPPPVFPPPGRKAAASPPDPPCLPPGPRPPPPPKGGSPPCQSQANTRVKQPTSLGPKKSGNSISREEVDVSAEATAPKTKLKPFFWDKVHANANRSMVWDQIKEGSFQFNEEMIETLFGYNTSDNKSGGKKGSSSKDPSSEYVRILDSKKSQNLAISLKALNVKTEDVCNALMEGNELLIELLQILLRMAPSSEEELKLRLYSGDHSLLGPAEQFIKSLMEIPFAFQRMEALLFMASLHEEVPCIKESFSTLEVACKELKSNRLFLKLLEAVLKTGNRMNDGTFRGHAHAFKLDTLLKLSDVKGIDGKTTLLHFVVQEIIRSEGVRAARLVREGASISSLNFDDLVDDSTHESEDYFRNIGLKVVSGLSNELENVKKAASLDSDALTSTVKNLQDKLEKTKKFLHTSMQSIEEESGFHQSLRSFVQHAEADITSLKEEENRIKSLVKDTTDYFHGSTGRDEGFCLFVIVRDFLGMLNKACREVADLSKKAPKTSKIRETPLMSLARDPQETPTMSPAQDPRETPAASPARDSRETPKASPPRDPRELLFPAIRDRRIDYSSSDDESPWT